MPMQLPGRRLKPLLTLVKEFNDIRDDDHVQRLFYLQKINFLLNTYPLSDDLYSWMTSIHKDSFQNHLAIYSISPDASFLLKGIQFAQAVARHLKKDVVPEEKLELHEKVYELMQKRDALLENNTFAECQDAYRTLSLELNELSLTDSRIKSTIERQLKILNDAQPKIDVVKGNKNPDEIAKLGISYKTKQLGAKGNNQNFEFRMGKWEPMVFRVEDRTDLKLEQRLQSHPVSKYFIEDYAVFIKKFKGDDTLYEYKPVVLSQFASQGNLAEVARRLQKDSVLHIAPKIGFYFDQLTHFISLLEDAKVYHPDLKLTNFLAHQNRMLHFYQGF